MLTSEILEKWIRTFRKKKQMNKEPFLEKTVGAVATVWEAQKESNKNLQIKTQDLLI